MRKFFWVMGIFLILSPAVHAKKAKSVTHGKHAKHEKHRSHAPRVVREPKPVSTGDWRLDAIQEMGSGSLLVQDAQGRVMISHEADVPRMPASTIKVATAAAALKILGSNYHFPTDFFWTPDGVLTVKGYGDPTLISEELARAVHSLKRAGVTRVTKIRLDASYFDSNINIDVNGHDGRRNPFDADNGALVVNFNTATVRITGTRKGKLVESADPTTPLTPVVVERARSLARGTHRIDVARNQSELLRFAGELIAAFLQEARIPTSGDIVAGTAPVGARPIYRHHASTSLTGIVIGMLEFSNNFTANQLFLATGAAQLDAPATVAKSVKVTSDFLRQNVGWKNFTIAEGSGLSRQNLVSATDMMKLLRYFKPNENLLPLKEQVFRAKSGTLADVSSLVGYFPMPGGGDAAFVILINHPKANYVQKFKVARTLYRGITGLGYPK